MLRRRFLQCFPAPIMPPYSRGETSRFMKAEAEKWVPIVRASGARVD